VEKFGQKLRQLRQHSGYTARELAEQLETSHTHILQIEKGGRGPSAQLILKISLFFEVSTDQLMRDDLELS